MILYIFTIFLLLTVGHLPQACLSIESSPKSVSSESSNDSHEDNLRNRRDADIDKRIREFVGKRSESQLDELIGVSNSQLVPDVVDQPEKRPRQFVGKRSEDKRVRDFVGKRFSSTDYLEQFSKRLREFVGKRDSDDVDKRVREFVGKRDRFVSELDNAQDNLAGNEIVENLDRFLAVKRPRQFVGKRSDQYFVDPMFNEVKRPRQFVGKRSNPYFNDEILYTEKRPRQFVGKRGAPYFDDVILNQEKRPRQFVGKRYVQDGDLFFFTDKRPRQFVGKRSELTADNDVEKRPRQFVGKRNVEDLILSDAAQRKFITGNILQRLIADNPKLEMADETDDQVRLKRSVSECGAELEKRLREFVGKRGGADPEADRTNLHKELQDFIDKSEQSSSCVSLAKRVREFVGKREEKRPRQFVGKRSVSGHLESTR
ncbi:hypothetical protein Btru_069890 [Bulinus truncatus]|nr:hypothetical protein Btru_069890 [Bulinus truncatus]